MKGECGSVNGTSGGPRSVSLSRVVDFRTMSWPGSVAGKTGAGAKFEGPSCSMGVVNSSSRVLASSYYDSRVILIF
jgi:hypothetical protein